MGYAVFRKNAAPGLPNSKLYLYYSVASTALESGWTIDSEMKQGRGLAYLGPSACGGNPSKKN